MDKKFSIRPICYSDLKFLNKWKNDEETYKFLGGGYKPTSIDEHRLWMENIVKNSDTSVRFIILTNSTLEPIGQVGLYSINSIHRNAEIEIFIGEKEYIGTGAADYAIKEVERYAIDYLNLKKIKAFVVDSNSRAVGFWKKHKYIEVGKLKMERYICGSYHDVHLFEKFLGVRI